MKDMGRCASMYGIKNDVQFIHTIAMYVAWYRRAINNRNNLWTKEQRESYALYLFVPLYKTFVRPKLEHAVAAWSPWSAGDIETLEKVQKRMVRLISNKKGSTYEERLESIGISTLSDRRKRGDMIETF